MDAFRTIGYINSSQPVITRNPRVSVTHDKHDRHRTWYLHINNVHEEDKGRYMCQINTVTAKTQFGYLNVVGKDNHVSLTSECSKNPFLKLPRKHTQVCFLFVVQVTFVNILKYAHKKLSRKL
uniref:Uncharacterized protein n=1 Tax=Megaselia scalaris TaxID=36166 RepID=T1GIQ2_MEGSC